MKLTDRLTVIKGVGEKTQEHFQKLNIYTVSSLIEHFPRSYERFELPVPCNALCSDRIEAVEVSIASSAVVRRAGNRVMISCRVKDPSGSLQVIWYNQPYIKNLLRPGSRFILRGRLSIRKGELVLEQPKMYQQAEYRQLLSLLQPVYSLTEGLTNHAVSKAIDRALLETEYPEDFLSAELRKRYHLVGRKQALKEIHFPKSEDTLLEARKRLVFDEFFIYILNISKRKQNQLEKKTGFPMLRRMECLQMTESLPYTLTGAQRRVWDELQQDLCGQGIMNRLIQGDVGSGKTVLAALCLLLCAKNGYQGSLMVPTEVLARQHYQTLGLMLQPYGVRTALLTGSLSATEKKRVQAMIAAHEVDVVVGTHALIQDKVEYDKLALVITDEQHRFGVRQRESLAKKSVEPHLLVMSATPIPRTLSIILYGDLDLSVLDELPANRLPIKNCVVGADKRATCYRFITKQVEQGHQAYVICPMVEESEDIEAENVMEYAELLRSELPEGIMIEPLHGKMKQKDKNEIMERFASGITKVLVSTTVVEVGVDVTNATVIMIENSERFGLAQLHQLRGRVGRGSAQSYCMMINTSETAEAEQRLAIMNQSNDGFFIASEDLRLRGPGDVLGVRQSGELIFQLADVFQDASTLKEASEAAKDIIGQNGVSCEKLRCNFAEAIVQLVSEWGIDDATDVFK